MACVDLEKRGTRPRYRDSKGGQSAQRTDAGIEVDPRRQAVRALVPRVFADVEDWFETEMASMGAHPIRVEDFRDNDKYVLRAELPGIDPARDVEINVDRGVLTVEAERSEQKHDKYRTEFRYGALRRSVTLPSPADEDKISARYDKGVLEVTVPLRQPEPAGRSIPVEQTG